MQLKQYFADKRSFYHFKDAHREKATSNNISSLSKIMNMDIWVVGTSNQLFIQGS